MGLRKSMDSPVGKTVQKENGRRTAFGGAHPMLEDNEII
jgi:hypothetical protein